MFEEENEEKKKLTLHQNVEKLDVTHSAVKLFKN